jgi:3D (Asp-Asp-Asp) domain-containing protein
MRRLVTVLGAALLLASPSIARGDAVADSARAKRAASPVTKRRARSHLPPPTSHLRAKPGEKIPVVVTYYCLQGTTRTDTQVREGIVAADPRVFPLRRHVELTSGGRSLGRFLIADTGSKIKGRALDIWVPSCAEARRRGRHHATAVLLTRAESRAERAKERKRVEAERLARK